MININRFEWNKPNFLLISFCIEALGIRQLSSFLQSLGCKVHILFLEHKIDSHFNYFYAIQVLNLININSYDIVGFSCMTGDYYEAKSISKIIKSQKNRSLIIWGGVHPSTCPEECLRDGGADIVFNGAAEYSLSELLNGTSIKKVNNIAFLEAEQTINNYINIIILDPNSMPFPDFNLSNHFIMKNDNIIQLNTNEFRNRYPWRGTHYYGITARGCPYNCFYCCNIYHGKILRKSVDYFIAELSYIKKQLPYFSTLSIQDDSLFMHNIKWITDFSEKYTIKFRYPFRAALMPRFATHDKLEPLKKAGLVYVGIGLQGSSRLNREIYGRDETSESFLKAVDNYSKYGIVGRVDIIIDNPYEREEDLLEIALTLNQVPKPFPISTFTLKLFPGTKLASKVKDDGLEHLFAGNPYTPNLSLDDRIDKNVYLTPDHYRKLFNDFIPNLPKNLCYSIIIKLKNTNIQSILIKYYKYPHMVREIGSMIRMLSPRYFDQLLRVFHKIKKNRIIQ